MPTAARKTVATALDLVYPPKYLGLARTKTQKNMCHGQKLDQVSRLKLPRSEVGGVAWRPTNWAMELTSGPFFQMMKYLTPSPVACPCHYRVTYILTDLEVVSMSTSCVFLDQFGSLRLTRGRCPHDVTDRYLLMVTMDQSSCAVEGCKSVFCLQAFVFADLLDVSSDGDGVMPTPECRTGRDDGLHQVIRLVCGGFSGWSHASRFLSGLEFPIFTCLALDVDHERVLAFHMTFGGSWPLQNKENPPKTLKSENRREEMNSW